MNVIVWPIHTLLFCVLGILTETKQGKECSALRFRNPLSPSSWWSIWQLSHVMIQFPLKPYSFYPIRMHTSKQKKSTFENSLYSSCHGTFSTSTTPVDSLILRYTPHRKFLVGCATKMTSGDYSVPAVLRSIGLFHCCA